MKILGKHVAFCRIALDAFDSPVESSVEYSKSGRCSWAKYDFQTESWQRLSDNTRRTRLYLSSVPPSNESVEDQRRVLIDNIAGLQKNEEMMSAIRNAPDNAVSMTFQQLLMSYQVEHAIIDSPYPHITIGHTYNLYWGFLLSTTDPIDDTSEDDAPLWFLWIRRRAHMPTIDTFIGPRRDQWAHLLADD